MLVCLLSSLIPLISFFVYVKFVKKQINQQSFRDKVYNNKLLFVYPFIFFLLPFLVFILQLTEPNFFVNVINIITNQKEDFNSLITFSAYIFLTINVLITFLIFYAYGRRKILVVVAGLNFINERLKKSISRSRICSLIIFTFSLFNLFGVFQLILNLFLLITSQDNFMLYIYLAIECCNIVILFSIIFVIFKNFTFSKKVINLPVYKNTKENNNSYQFVINPFTKTKIQRLTIFTNQKTYLPEIGINKTTFFYISNPKGKNIKTIILGYEKFMEFFEKDIYYDLDKAYIEIKPEELELNNFKEQNENKF